MDARLQYIIRKTGDLPPMPKVAQKILSIVSNPETSARDLQKLISSDQALAAKILKISNSALFSLMREISSLSHAIMILGFSTIKSIVLTSSAQAIFKGSKQSLKDKILWEHSVFVAIASRILSEKRYPSLKESAFTGGLLHDIGKAILSKSLEREYDQIFQEVYGTPHSFLDHENEIFGFNHTDVGYLVLQKWNISNILEETVHFHHHIEKSSHDFLGIVNIVSLSNNLSHKFGYGTTKSPDLIIEELAEYKFLKFTPDEFSRIMDSIVENFQKEKQLFDI